MKNRENKTKKKVCERKVKKGGLVYRPITLGELSLAVHRCR